MPAKPGTTRNLLLACFLTVSAIIAALAAFLITNNRKGSNDNASSLRAASPTGLVPVAAITSVPSPAPMMTLEFERTNTTNENDFVAQNGASTPVPMAATSTTATPVEAPSTDRPIISPPTLPPSLAATTGSPITSQPTSTTLPPSTGSPVVSTFVPTSSPMDSPFDAPTFPPQVFPAFDEENTIFRLKMYWQQGFFWQEETRERFWCVECTKCETLNFSDNGEECDFAWECEAGHQLWLHGCRNGYGHVFRAKTVGDYHQILVHETNLCLERTQKRYVTVQECDSGNDAQWWHKIRADGGPFELRPANESRDPEPFCVTQQHHPKPGEVLGLKECRQAHRWETGYWNAFRLYPGN